MNKFILMQGDCLVKMNEIHDRTIDMVLVDMPYGTTRCKWDSIICLDSMWKNVKRIVKHDAAIVMTASQPFTTTLINSNIEMFKYCWVWEKSKASNFVHANYQPLKTHEDICVFSFGGSAQGSKNAMKYNPQHTEGKPYNKGVGNNNIELLQGGLTKRNTIKIENKSGLRKPRSVIYHKTAELEGKYHPTQKPIALMQYLIKTYTNENETVLDFCMGSGSTGIACINTNRKFIGIELDKNYFNVAKNRIYEKPRFKQNLSKIQQLDLFDNKQTNSFQD
tara:strand:+ start:80 stop:913 length:834 start_codon:yes stop_codon:yes gene_type:complete